MRVHTVGFKSNRMKDTMTINISLRENHREWGTPIPPTIAMGNMIGLDSHQTFSTRVLRIPRRYLKHHQNFQCLNQITNFDFMFIVTFKLLLESMLYERILSVETFNYQEVI